MDCDDTVMHPSSVNLSLMTERATLTIKVTLTHSGLRTGQTGIVVSL